MTDLGVRRFNRRMRDLLRQYCPIGCEGQTDAQLDDRIQALMANAVSWGLRDEQSAAMFVFTGFNLGDGFDMQIPRIREVLESDWPAHTKAQFLEDFTVQVLETLGLAVEADAQASATASPSSSHPTSA